MSLAIPIAYIRVRYGELFETKTLRLSFMSVLCFALIIGVVIVMIKYYVSGMKAKYSLFKQVLEGLCKVILPLGIVLALAILFKVKSEYMLANVDKFIESMIVVIVCELGAVIVNPLPKWAFENNVEGFSEIVDKILTKKHKEQEQEGEK